MWLSGGVEADSPKGKIIRWSQPEIVLYDDDPIVRMSYPDLVEDGGKYFLTETQKDIARVHEIDQRCLKACGIRRRQRPSRRQDSWLKLRAIRRGTSACQNYHLLSAARRGDMALTICAPA